MSRKSIDITIESEAKMEINYRGAKYYYRCMKNMNIAHTHRV